jgi:hypothetical protein
VTPLDSEPYLTIVVVGRNDNLGGHFSDRFFRALRFNCEQLRMGGITFEIVFVEWRPVAGRPLLSTLLVDAFADLPPHELRAYVVDPAFHDALSLNSNLQFQEFIAKNVGIRRARGRYVLATNTDVYLGREVLKVFEGGGLQPETLYRACRVDVTSLENGGLPTFTMFEDPLNHRVVNHIRPPYFTNASGDFLLLDRRTWHRLRGFNEIYRLAKVHMDKNFCYKCYGAGLELVDLGGPIYHMGTGTLHAEREKFSARPDLAPWGDIRWNSKVLYDNPPGWGLGSAEERVDRSQVVHLTFGWPAVPALVDLRRIVSPVARLGRPN